MQRDSAAHLPAVPANDSRDTPLNRLLRKPGGESETPAAKPAGDTPPVQPPAMKSPAAPASATAAAPLASPAEMLVQKLTGRAPGIRSVPASRPLPAPVPEVAVAEKPIDVDYTPLEPPAERPPEESVVAETADVTAPEEVAALDTVREEPEEDAPVETTASNAPEQVAALEMAAPKVLEEDAPVQTIARTAPEEVAAPETGHKAPGADTPVETAARAAPDEESAVPTAARKALPMLGTSLTSLVAKPPLPQRSAEPVAKPLPAPRVAAQTPVEEPPPARAPMVAAPAAQPARADAPVQAAAAAKPQPAPQARPQPVFDKPPLGPISSPDAPAESPQPRGTAVARSIGKLLPGRDPAPEKSAGKLPALPRRTRDEREFLPAALEIVDTPPSPVGRAVGFTIILVAVIAIAWACIGKIDIVATASGRIVPQGKTKIVQPADTGIVTAIHVSDGDHVKAGDPLIELNSIQVLADRDRFVRDLLQAKLSLARLRGLAEALPGSSSKRRQPNLVDPPKDAKPEDLALTLAAMRAQAANEHAKLADLDQQIQAKEAEAAEAVAAAQKLQASLPMLADQEKLLRDMRDQKIGSKLDWFQINQQLIEQRHEIGVLSHRKDAAEAAQRALREQRAAEAAQFQMSVLADLDKTRALASELEAELAKSEQRTRQNILLSPIDGTVQQLAIHTIGGVVTPAESLMAIVPAEGGLVVEAMVQNRDVGFIGTGQTVRVKVEAFNFTLYGLIEGEVIGVTRDAVSQPASDKKSNNGSQTEGDNVASENSGPVYLARIALSQDWMMTENGKVQLTPGMTVTAEIQTGQRRLISYLLSPIVRRVSESMHER